MEAHPALLALIEDMGGAPRPMSHFNATHGMKGTKVYKAWDCMKQRCLNPRHKSYARYGGRGISVCHAWRASFESFYAEVGDPPTPHHTLERIDNDRGYEPGNVRWATYREQAQNRISNRYLLAFGETKLVVEWARDPRCSVSLAAFEKRLAAGWAVERALVQPLGPTSKRHRAPHQAPLFQ